MSIKIAHLSSDIANASPVHSTQHGAIELSQQARHRTRACLTGIFPYTHVMAIVQFILAGPMASDQREHAWCWGLPQREEARVHTPLHDASGWS